MDNIRLMNPVVHGDTLYAYSEVLSGGEGRPRGCRRRHLPPLRRQPGRQAGLPGRSAHADQAAQPLGRQVSGDRPAGPLDGLKVLDFTQALAGPFCTQLLADLGAEVVKVEALDGDDSRTSARSTPTTSARYRRLFRQSINRGKKSDRRRPEDPTGADLRQAPGRRLRRGGRELPRRRDGPARPLLRDRCASVNPRLVYAAIRGFGDPRTGESPYVDWPAYDVVAQAMGGMMGITGLDGDSRSRSGPASATPCRRSYAALGIVSAVLHAHETGEGQFLDVAMVDAVLASASASSTSLLRRHRSGTGGQPPSPLCRSASFRPGRLRHHRGAGRPSSGRCALMAGGSGRRSRYPDRPAARRRRGLVMGRRGIHRRHSKAELGARLGGMVGSGPFKVEEISADPHFAARGMWSRSRIRAAPNRCGSPAFRSTTRNSRHHPLAAAAGSANTPDTVLGHLRIFARRSFFLSK